MYPGVRKTLGELWRDREWRFLLNLIDHLPSNSHFGAAIADDEEYAVASLGKDRSDSPSPAIKDWTPEVNLLALVADRLSVLTSLIASMRGGRYVAPPVPRPVTARDRVRRQLAEAKHNRLVARLIKPDEREEALQ